MAIAVLQVLLNQAEANERPVTVSETSEAVVEALARYMAATMCRHDVCVLTVDGRAATPALMRRLRDVPNIRAPSDQVSTTGKHDLPALTIDVGPVVLSPNKRATAGGSLTIGTAPFLSCNYPLRLTPKGWQVLQREAKCDTI
jgi:hypothetical protein